MATNDQLGEMAGTLAERPPAAAQRAGTLWTAPDGTVYQVERDPDTGAQRWRALAGPDALPRDVDLYADSEAGDDANTGAVGAPVRTLGRLLALAPPLYRGYLRLHLAPRATAYELAEDALRAPPGRPVGPGATAPVLVGALAPYATGTIAAAGNTGLGTRTVVSDPGLAAGDPSGAVLTPTSGAAAGLNFAVARGLSGTQLELSGYGLFAPPLVGATYQLARPGVTVNLAAVDSAGPLLEGYALGVFGVRFAGVGASLAVQAGELWLDCCAMDFAMRLDVSNGGAVRFDGLANAYDRQLFPPDAGSPAGSQPALAGDCAVLVHNGGAVDYSRLVTRGGVVQTYDGAAACVFEDIDGERANVLLDAGSAYVGILRLHLAPGAGVFRPAVSVGGDAFLGSSTLGLWVEITDAESTAIDVGGFAVVAGARGAGNGSVTGGWGARLRYGGTLGVWGDPTRNTLAGAGGEIQVGAAPAAASWAAAGAPGGVNDLAALGSMLCQARPMGPNTDQP